MSKKNKTRPKKTQSTTETRAIGTVKTADAFSNPVARLGYGTQNLMEATEYPLTRLTQNYALLNSLYRGNWIVQNIIGTIPEDVTKKWFRVKTNAAPEYIDKINKLQRQTKLRRSIVEGMKWGRLYGGAIGLILLEGQDEFMSEPLNYDTIQPDSFKGLYIADRWSGVYPDTELITDINDPEFGLPAYYEIRNEQGAITQRVHHSRVIRFIGRELPYLEKVVETYWGQSEIEAIYDEIIKRDNVSYNIASLTFRANLSVYEMDNLDQLFAVGGTEAQRRFWNMIQAQSVLESNLGVKMVNKGDEVHQLQYSFTGLAEVYESIMLDVAGAARMPVTKLFGRSPAGLNATGESDLRNYYDYLEEIREKDFRPVIEKLLPIMALSAWGEIPDDLDFMFDELWTPTENEKASIVKNKVGALIEAFNANGMTQEAFMKELKTLSGSTGMFGNIADETVEQGRNVWARDLQSMNDPLAGLMPGGFDDLNDTEEFEADNKDMQTIDGGAGSGNFGHRGRPGERGGSGDGSGNNAQMDKLLGKEYKGVKGQAAVDKLLEERQGYVKSAFQRSDVGDITLLWGNDSMGMQHIIKRRREEKQDEKAVMSNLAKTIENGKLSVETNRHGDRFVITHGDYEAIVAPRLFDSDIKFVLTAYEKYK